MKIKELANYDALHFRYMQSLWRYELESRAACLANMGKPDAMFISDWELSIWGAGGLSTWEMGCFICFWSARMKHSN